MAGINGIGAMFGLNEVKGIFDEFISDVKQKQIEALQYVGEEFVNRARDLRTYQDDTGNLRASIGYIILDNGKVVDANFKKADGDDGETGVLFGYEKAEEVALLNPLGLVLIGVAGMNYAAAVESKGYDVITGPAEECVKLLKEVIDEIHS